MKSDKLIIGSVALMLLGCSHAEHRHQEAPTYITTRPIKKDTLYYQEYVSQIHSIQHIELRAFERGYLNEIYVDEGQLVKKGQLLFQIMPVIYQAEVQKALAEAKFAALEFENTKSLADSNIVSQNELELSEATLQQAEASLNLAKAHLAFTEIRAPFDGIVGRFKDVRLGSLVEEGELLTTLSDNSKMWVYFNVPEAEYLDFSMNEARKNQSKVKLKLANNRLFERDGVVETIEADFNNETGNIAFRATFLNPEQILRNGQTGNIMLPTYLEDALLLPQKATFEILDKKYVYTVAENGLVQAKEIITGAEIPHTYEVLEGLGENDMVLVEGLRKVKEGDTIRYNFLEPQEILLSLSNLHAE
ncbi:membrane fusion protein, multidrug efflux system [Cyclobacterium lianum]|uniref:Membrane fusion protein, multidrug efflux system n=1 Tax=Cyclobacterium lianum TaxID=388280 RepID=A0A1M7N2N2_9BACT|nr:efflux RND transporter periplasmic adaptor subunit [Cyclobacterium lianum]SHM97677.1 membrane fusion protein, multidrug efflux system [Cyclobacterium lianum]